MGGHLGAGLQGAVWGGAPKLAQLVEDADDHLQHLAAQAAHMAQQLVQRGAQHAWQLPLQLQHTLQSLQPGRAAAFQLAYHQKADSTSYHKASESSAHAVLTGLLCLLTIL